jgi:hypothetical protein
LPSVAESAEQLVAVLVATPADAADSDKSPVCQSDSEPPRAPPESYPHPLTALPGWVGPAVHSDQ